MTAARVSRRAILTGAAAAAVVAPAAHASGPADPLIALGERWIVSVQRYKVESDVGDAIHRALSKDARGGWPIVDRTNPVWRDFPRQMYEAVDGCRPSRSEIKAFNIERNDAVATDPAALAQSRAEGRLRMREHTNRLKSAKLEREESGWNAHVARSDRLLDSKDTIEKAIAAAHSTTIAGAIVKLRVAARWIILNHSDASGGLVDEIDVLEERLTIAALADFERLAAGGAS